MKHLYVLLFIIAPIALSAQGVKIATNPGQPDASAVLELDHNAKGFLLTRMTMQERNAIVNPAIGLQIYNTTSQCLEIYFLSGCHYFQMNETGEF